MAQKPAKRSGRDNRGVEKRASKSARGKQLPITAWVVMRHGLVIDANHKRDMSRAVAVGTGGKVRKAEIKIIGRG